MDMHLSRTNRLGERKWDAQQDIPISYLMKQKDRLQELSLEL